MRLTVFALFTGLAFAQNGPTAPVKPMATIKAMEADMATKEAELQWLRQKVALLEQKLAGLAQFWQAHDGLQAVERQKPEPPKPIVAQKE